MSPGLLCMYAHAGGIFHQALGVMEANDSEWLWPRLNEEGSSFPRKASSSLRIFFSADYLLVKKWVKIVTFPNRIRRLIAGTLVIHAILLRLRRAA